MDHLARVVGASRRQDVPEIFEGLNRELGIPSRLRDMNLTMEELQPMIELALQDHCSLTNPRQITLEDCEKLYREAF